MLLKSMKTRDELSTTCNPKVMSRFLSAPDATSLHHCLNNKQLKPIWFLWYGSKYFVLFTVEEGVANRLFEAPQELLLYFTSRLRDFR